VGSRTGLDSLEKTKSLALMEMNTIPWLSTSTSRQKLDPHIVTQQGKSTIEIERMLYISQTIEEHVPLHNGKCFTKQLSQITLDILQDKHENFNKIRVKIVLI
jgi:hypothetical protein